MATGYATTPEECEAAVLAIDSAASSFNTSLAARHHRKLCVEKRMREPCSNTKKPVQQEYVYTDHFHSDYDFWDRVGPDRYSRPHKIIKVTPRFVFVETDR